MRALRYVSLLLLPLLCGCHVVERAKRCGHLASIITDAAPEIAATKIEDSPPAQVLRKKARLYGQLAERLDKVPLEDKKARDEQKALILHLQNLERHLLDAGTAVEAEEAYTERQEEMHVRRPPASSASPQTRPSNRHGMPGFLDRGKRPDDARKSPPLPPKHFTPNARKYERAKHAVETIGRAVESSMRNLEAACQ